MIILLSRVFIVPALAANLGDLSGLSITTPLVFLLIGMFIMLYAYNISEWLHVWRTKLMVSIRSGSVTVSFGLVSLLFLLIGLIVGYLSLGDLYIPSLLAGALWFVYNALWLMIFAVLIYQVGDLVDIYISTKKIKLSFIIGSMNLVALGLIATGTLDIILAYFDMGLRNTALFTLELVAGVGLALLSALLQHYMKGAIETAESTKDPDTDAA
jgi:putative membrane protein